MILGGRAGVNMPLGQMFLIKLEGYAGSSLFSNQYFNMSFNAGGELSAGMMFKDKFFVGVCGGYEWMRYCANLLEYSSMNIEAGIKPHAVNADKSFFYGRGFVGAVLGYQLSTNVLITLRGHYMLSGKQSEEGAKYEVQDLDKIKENKGEKMQKISPDVTYASVRAMMGLEWRI